MTDCVLKFKERSMAEALQWCESVDSMSDDDFEKQEELWKRHSGISVSAPYGDLRESVVAVFDSSSSKVSGRGGKYQIDIEVGVQLFLELERLGFTLVDAENDDIWRFFFYRSFS